MKLLLFKKKKKNPVSTVRASGTAERNALAQRLTRRRSLLTALGAGSSRSRRRRIIRHLVRGCFLACRRPPSHCVRAWQREREFLCLPLLMRTLIPPQGSTLVTSSSPDPLPPPDTLTPVLASCQRIPRVPGWLAGHEQSRTQNRIRHANSGRADTHVSPGPFRLRVSDADGHG